MKIAILGFGLQGASALEYWRDQGHDITVCDIDTEVTVPEGVATRLGPDYLKDLNQFDMLVRTPVLRPTDIVAANSDAPDILSKVTSVTNEFFRVCPTANIIGVTGTKGKGTTSTLITRILEAAGKRVHLGGNIGTPPLELLKAGIRPGDWVVLELANFQLIDLKISPHIGVCLMVVPEHLDWHPDMTHYAQAKQQMFRWQTANDIAIFNRQSAHSAEIASISPGRKISFEVPGPGAEPSSRGGVYVDSGAIFFNDQAVCNIGQVELLGRHNLENVCAAIAATWDLINHDVSVVTRALAGFRGLEHRLEFVRELDGIKYYDDSFGTTPETAIVAIQAFDRPIVAILGGSDKGSRFDALAHVIAAHDIRAAVVIGQTGPAIAKALRTAGYDNIVKGGDNMKAVVEAARKHAQAGDVVLLSTGCASFGMFKNYKDRGEQFKQAVQELA